MYRLVYKDFMLIKKAVLFFLAFSLYIDFLGLRSPSMPGIIYIIIIVLFSYIFMIYSNGYDDKNKGEMIFNSMPIKRSSLVLGKYLDILFFIIFTGITLMISSEIMKTIFISSSIKITGRAASISDVLYALIIVGIYFSVYLPFYFKLGGSRLQLFNQISYMLFIMMPYIVLKVLTKFRASKIVSFLININMDRLKIILIFMVILLFTLSIVISINIYKRRDL
ncbi:MAG: ABC-2 transporter permease [Clostridiaceae bacterium]